MKRSVIFGAALAAGLAVTMAACTERVETPAAEKTVDLTIVASQSGADTRVAVDGINMTWVDGDEFRLWDDVPFSADYKWKMSLVSGVGTGSGTFNCAAVASHPARRKFYAVAPYITNSVSDLTKVPVSVATDQVVAGPSDNAGVGSYMVNVGYAECDGDPAGGVGSVAMHFEPVTSVWEIAIDNTAGKTIRGVRIEAVTGKPFVAGGTIDITQNYAGTPANPTPPVTVSPTNAASASSSIGTTWSTPSNAATTLSARIVMLPTQLSAAALRIVVSTADGKNYVFNRPSVTKNFLRGTVYHSAVDMSSLNSIETLTIFSETFGTGTSATNIIDYSDWTKSGTGVTASTAYGFEGSVEVNPTAVSPSGYSGESSLLLGSAIANTFIVQNIDVTGVTDMTISMGLSTTKNSTGPGDVSVALSVDGGAHWTASLAFTTIIPPSSSWTGIASEFSLPNGTTRLWIKIAPAVANLTMRVDDLLLVAGATSPTLNEYPIYRTGFEATEGFTAKSTFIEELNLSGPDDKQWSTYFGTPTTIDKIAGDQSLQMRWSSNALGSTETTFALANVTRVTFSAKTNNTNFSIKVSYHDGEDWVEPGWTKTLSLVASSVTVDFGTQASPVANVAQIRFTIMKIGSVTTGTYRVTIDDVVVYGMR